MLRFRTPVALLAALSLLLAACGDDDDQAATTAAEVTDDTGAAEPTEGDRPTVVVTTTTLGDVVENLVGDQADVVTVMPVGADPHDFQASAQQVNAMRQAAALVVNGGGFEEGLLDVVRSAESDGVPTHEAITDVDTIEFGAAGHGHGDEEEDDHGHEGEEEGAHEGEEEDGHHHDGADPHFFQDPARMAAAAAGIGAFLAEHLDGIDVEALEASVDAYVAELEALDAEVEEILTEVPEDRRVLVTNHDAFGYFADRYGFEVVGTVIPSGSTSDGTGAAALAELAETVRAEQVPAIFTENVASSSLANALATEVGGDVELVELYTDSLGDDGSDAATYVDMIRTNAERIAAALA